MLIVAPISISYASVRVFSRGVFGAVLSGPSPVPSFFKVCHLGAWWFRGIPGGLLFFARYPLGHILIVRCSIPFPVLGGGERERKLLSIIMLSCNPNDRLDHILIDSFHLWIITVTVGQMLTCGLDGFADLVYVGLGV